jgi:DNA-binding NarL/FixJ family response regulator
MVIASPYPILLMGIRQFLRPVNNMRIVAEASTALEMLERCAHSTPDVCVVDFDIARGQVRGVIDALRSTCSMTSILLFIGACTDAKVSIKGLSGGIACVAKSASSGELIAAIRIVANQARRRVQAG